MSLAISSTKKTAIREAGVCGEPSLSSQVPSTFTDTRTPGAISVCSFLLSHGLKHPSMKSSKYKHKYVWNRRMRVTKAAFIEIKVKLHVFTSIFTIHIKIERFPVLSSDHRWKNRKHKGTVVIGLMLKGGA